jgi:membrane-associated phospholipid phosphatase
VIELLSRERRYSNIEEREPRVLEFDKTKWPIVVAAIGLLALLNANPLIHREIINIDMHVALVANSAIGFCPFTDRLAAWLNTRLGDVLVLSVMVTIFLIHSLRGSTGDEVASRMAFWGWVAVLCVIGYELEGCLEPFVKREIPLLVLPQLKNVQTMYGVTLRTDPYLSFPSGHATAYLFFVLMSWRRYWRMSLLILGLGFVMLSTRLIVGIHWLSDITLGALPCVVLLASLTRETPLKISYLCFEKVVFSALRLLTDRPFSFPNGGRSELQFPPRWWSLPRDSRQRTDSLRAPKSYSKTISPMSHV